MEYPEIESPDPARTGSSGMKPHEILAREILETCRGEGPANCVARCPLHVDARAYVQLAGKGLFEEALQKVREKLPFPGILGYICAHPCELHCKKVDEDTPVRIRDIKRFLAESEEGRPRHILTCEPSRGKRVAVVGAGPAGLLAAHDLRRHGWNVTIFEQSDSIGGCLIDKIPAWRLPRKIIERDLSIISELGIDVRTGIEVGIDVSIDELRRDHDALLLLVGYAGARKMLRSSAELEATRRGLFRVDPTHCTSGIEGVFAGGDAISGPGTVITALALGRRAAKSVHLFLNGENPPSDRESPLPPKLLWGLEVSEEERLRRIRPPVMLQAPTEAMTDEDVLTEAGRCLDCECGNCLRDCEFLEKNCSSPKDLARMVLDGLSQPETLKMVYSCNICSLCETVCPEKLDTGAMLLEARREAVRLKLGPLPVHKGIIGYFNAGVSRLFSLTRAEPGRRRSRRLFFTGCSLPAVAPAHTRKVYEELNKYFPGTGVMMYCCGAPVELLGMDEEFENAGREILRRAEAVGAEELIAACPDCAHTLRNSVPELKIRTAWEMLDGVWTPPTRGAVSSVAVHDSCKARHDPDTCRSVRNLLTVGGADIEEIEYNGEKARCCGFGGMIYPVDPDLSTQISRRRSNESELPMITYCAGCRMALAGAGKESVHILDFLLDPDWQSRATSPPPGGLTRYFNRLRTKWSFMRMKPSGRQ